MNSKTHVFHNILKKKFFHEFMLTYITSVSTQHLEGLSSSIFVSFISKDSLILRSCLLGNFPSVFGCSQLKATHDNLWNVQLYLNLPFFDITLSS